jgi:MSHA biogenesis protein MshE
VCTDCAQPTTPTANQLAWLATCRPDLSVDRQKFMAGAGCTYCNLSGYRGRVAVYEILEIDRLLADAVRRGDLEGFARAARSSEGYVPLAQGAIDFALSGTSSLAEAMAVGSGLEEFVDVDAAAPLADATVETLLEQRA